MVIKLIIGKDDQIFLSDTLYLEWFRNQNNLHINIPFILFEEHYT